MANINIPKTSMKTYSCRAECQPDILVFVQALWDKGFCCQIDHMKVTESPDTAVEFTTNASLEEMIEISRELDDNHVLRQTLEQAPMEGRTMKRNYDLR